MKLHRTALPIIFVQSVVSQRQINGVASPGNFILSENEIDLGSLLPSGTSTLMINSPVPISIHRFSDNNSFSGGEALPKKTAKVLVISNCGTDDTNVVPVFGEDPSNGSITISIAGTDLFDPKDPFLESSSYAAQWSVKSDFCGSDGPWSQPWDGSGGDPTIIGLPVPGGIGIPAPVSVPSTDVGTTCQSDADCIWTSQFCQLKFGACDESGLHEGICLTKPELCGEIYDPVCGCNGEDYGNKCEAEVAGVSVSRMGTCAGKPQDIVLSFDECPEGECRDPNGDCGEEVLCFEEPCDVSNPGCGADEVCINNRCGGKCTAVCGPKPSEINLGFGGDQTIDFVENPGGGIPPIEGIIPEGGIEFMPSNGADQSAPVMELSQPSGTAATTTMATMTAAKVDESLTATTTAATTIAAVDGNFPTKAPSPGTDDSKSPTSSPFQEISPGSSSAFGRSRSLSICVATAFMAIAILSVIFPGNGAHINLWGFGKVFVAAAAVSSIYSKLPGGTRGANTQEVNQNSDLFIAQNNNGRALQGTCSYNVEILIDGCDHSTSVNAPAGRVIDVSIDNKTFENDPEDECITDYTAELNFPVTADRPATVLEMVDGAPPPIVAELGMWSMECNQPVIGRPFVDATGGTLKAMPLIQVDRDRESCASSLSWTDSTLEEDVKSYSYTGNVTTHSHLIMGEDWMQRALGEHSSVASFSAFSIALMTNQAPSDLVEAALKAGLDEIRHAKVSFDIASKLTGKDVGPGPLPPSSHEFGQDLTALALAVAREGCVDETLSAFSAALEVEHINAVLDEGLQDMYYSNIDRDTLVLIRDALITIAMDESNHSALAWSTLNWVCNVDSNACDTVHSEVFEESGLNVRFSQRADSPFGVKQRLLGTMRGEWEKIFNAHTLAHADVVDDANNGNICGEGTAEAKDERSQPLFASVTEAIIRQVSCK